MKKILITLAVALIVMHLNQSLNAIYWIAFVTFVVTSLMAANRLDHERNK